MEYKDYYSILGLDRSASQDEIKRAYRKFARKYHPDVSKASDAKQRFQDVAEAYHALKDPERRAAYDQLGTQWHHGQEFHAPPGWEVHFASGPEAFGDVDASDFSDFFREIFGGGWPFAHGAPGDGRTFTDMRGRDIHATVRISLHDSYQGNTLQLTVPATRRDARGIARRGSQTLKVKIPRGVRAGQQIRLAGHGEPGTGKQPAGDLYLTVEFVSDALFHAEGRDIYITVPVAPWEAALGAEITVPTLGAKVELKVPSGSQSGRKLRMRGRGLPGKPAGDQYVVLRVVVPAATTEKEKELYRKWAKEMPFNPRGRMGG
ncbi:MAG: DnaJ domain-containing protein [Pseudomonadota bacterium]|nr:MAG: DnaJ domain-containing protein [Pseudomonadota bacterium]